MFAIVLEIMTSMVVPFGFENVNKSLDILIPTGGWSKELANENHHKRSLSASITTLFSAQLRKGWGESMKCERKEKSFLTENADRRKQPHRYEHLEGGE